MGILLLGLKGLAVRTVGNSGVHLMRAHGNAVQRTVVLSLAVMHALLYRAFNTGICLAVCFHFHYHDLPHL